MVNDMFLLSMIFERFFISWYFLYYPLCVLIFVDLIFNHLAEPYLLLLIFYFFVNIVPSHSLFVISCLVKRCLWARETGQETLNPSNSKFKALETREGEWDEGFKGKKRFFSNGSFRGFSFLLFIHQFIL